MVGGGEEGAVDFDRGGGAWELAHTAEEVFLAAEGIVGEGYRALVFNADVDWLVLARQNYRLSLSFDRFLQRISTITYC